MELDKLSVVTSFIHNIVVYNIPLLYGTVGEIVVEKSGSLNLGVEGIMAVGAIFGYMPRRCPRTGNWRSSRRYSRRWHPRP